MYGRVSNRKCLSNEMRESKCVSNIPLTIETVSNQCNSRNSCMIQVNSVNFDDKCVKIEKYLDVEYECN